jgi:aspartate/methionine/tyrosine aminotransferase
VAAGTSRGDRAAPDPAGRGSGRRPGGFETVSLGGFFAWVRHPFTDRPTYEVVRDLLLKHDTLVIPGTAFLPDDRRMLRISVGRIDEAGAATLARRLAAAGR